MLQNRHYYQEPFDEEMSKRIFSVFLKTIDPGKFYLLKSDVEGFRKKYETTLNGYFMNDQSIDVAMEMFDVVKARAKAREEEVNELIEKNKFTFDSDRKMTRDRDKVDWAETEEAIRIEWMNSVESLLLAEELRRTSVAKLAAEQGKENPLKDERPAMDSVKLKFKRDFESIFNTDREEVANYMISSLGAAYCPHTDYFSAREMDSFMSSIQMQLVGIGALLQAEEDGATKISGIVIGGPSEKQGDLQLNDRIIGVDHNNTGEMTDIMFMTLDKVVELIRGKNGTSVKLKVQPASNPTEIKHIVIKREKVELKGDKVKGQIIEFKKGSDVKRIGYIKLNSFYANFEQGGARCSYDVQKILVKMNQENVEGLVLDLRGNGGGSLDEVRRMTGLFTGHGPVVQVRNRANATQVHESDREPAMFTKPVVVAIDKSSASASEILAGAIQDYNRGVVIGDSSTYGKGTVQQPMDLKPWLPFMENRERAGFLKPTIQKFYRVAGSTTQLKGVESDIILPSVYGGLDVGEKYMDFALKHDKIDPAKGFKPLDRDKLFINKLTERSNERVKNSIDYQYLKDDLKRLEERIERNTVSLNKAERQKQLDEIDARTKQRNKERIERFAKLQQQDVEEMNVYRLELDDLKDKELFKLDLENITDTHMKLAKNDLADLNQTPDWPSLMNNDQREAIAILVDLIKLTNGEELVVKANK